MAQRTAIARALVRRPSILLLDEPFSALDSFTRQKLQQHLLALWERARFTLVFVTHDVLEAVTLSDRVMVMRGQPGRNKREIRVDIPRPRARTSPEVRALEDEIVRSEEHTSELQSLIRISYAVVCLKQQTKKHQ